MNSRTWRATLADLAAEHGGTLEHTQGTHLVIRLGNGARVYTSATPSDHRAIMNVRADVRRAARTAPRVYARAP